MTVDRTIRRNFHGVEGEEEDGAVVTQDAEANLRSGKVLAYIKLIAILVFFLQNVAISITIAISLIKNESIFVGASNLFFRSGNKNNSRHLKARGADCSIKKISHTSARSY